MSHLDEYRTGDAQAEEYEEMQLEHAVENGDHAHAHPAATTYYQIQSRLLFDKLCDPGRFQIAEGCVICNRSFSNGLLGAKLPSRNCEFCGVLACEACCTKRRPAPNSRTKFAWICVQCEENYIKTLILLETKIRERQYEAELQESEQGIEQLKRQREEAESEIQVLQKEFATADRTQDDEVSVLDKKLARVNKENVTYDEQIKQLQKDTEELQWQIENQEKTRQRTLREEQDRLRELADLEESLERADAQIKAETAWISQQCQKAAGQIEKNAHLIMSHFSHDKADFMSIENDDVLQRVASTGTGANLSSAAAALRNTQQGGANANGATNAGNGGNSNSNNNNNNNNNNTNNNNNNNNTNTNQNGKRNNADNTNPNAYKDQQDDSQPSYSASQNDEDSYPFSKYDETQSYTVERADDTLTHEREYIVSVRSQAMRKGGNEQNVKVEAETRQQDPGTSSGKKKGDCVIF